MGPMRPMEPIRAVQQQLNYVRLKASFGFHLLLGSHMCHMSLLLMKPNALGSSASRFEWVWTGSANDSSSRFSVVLKGFKCSKVWTVPESDPKVAAVSAENVEKLLERTFKRVPGDL